MAYSRQAPWPGQLEGWAQLGHGDGCVSVSLHVVVGPLHVCFHQGSQTSLHSGSRLPKL